MNISNRGLLGCDAV